MLLQRAFSSLVLPKWLHEMLDGNSLATADESAAVGKRPLKCNKTETQVLQSKLLREQTLVKLNETFFIQLVANGGHSLRAKQTCAAPFAFYVSAAKAADRENMKLYWTKCGFGESFDLFHPVGMTNPYNFRRYPQLLAPVTMHASRTVP